MTNAVAASEEVGRKQPSLWLTVHPSTWQRLHWALPVLALISLYYVFMGSAGHFHTLQGDLPPYASYYDRMCEGFRHGHLYVEEQPLPQLLAEADPYAGHNVQLWLWDASLYNGHYYLYWGPVPALFLLVIKVLLGTHERIPDQWLGTIFMIGRLLAGAGLILNLASRVRLRQPPWLCALAIGVFGLANPVPFVAARPYVYETALAGGQCFLFLGLWAAFWGLEKVRHRRRLFALASLLWALGAGCRATMFIPVPLIILVTAAFAWYASARSIKVWLLDCLAIGVPFAVGAAAYGLYNYARFDSPTEFGVNYQVTLQPFTGNASYRWPNLFSYLFAPVKWSCRFPFVSIIGYRELSPLLDWPPGYLIFERVGGIMRTALWCWLLPLCVARMIAHLGTLRRPLTLPHAPPMSRYELWLVLCSGAMMLSIVPVLSLWEASMRYAADAMGGITLAATAGVFWVLHRTYESRWRGFGLAWRALILVFGLQTCIVGAFAAVTTSDDPLKNRNPVLYQELETHLSFCGDSQ